MKARSFVAVAILLLASGAFVTSCGSEDKRQVSDSSDKSGEGGAEAQEKNNSGDSGGGGVFPAARATATIKGHVVYDGKLPRRLKTPISGEAFCEKCYPDGAPVSARYEIDQATKGVRWCFVEVLGADTKWKFEPPKDKLKLDQVNCRYAPHALGIMTGQTLVITSSDPIDHNVHFFGKNKPAWTNRIVHKGQLLKVVFKRPANEKYKCDIHGWMNAAVYVRSHTLYAVTDAKGSFTLPKLPAGAYEIKVVHEKWKKGETQTVTIGDGETKDITLKIKK